MDITRFNQDLFAFLQAATTPFHAAAEMARRLTKAGFITLDEREDWNLESQKKYFVTRNDSAIIAFTTGKGNPAETGLRMTGAHTDSPCPKVKPNPDMKVLGYQQLAVETYGGALLATWFDRDLSLAGRVTWQDKDGNLHSNLVDFVRPIAVIPSLAIHLDREANNNRSINPQKELPPVLSLLTEGDESQTFNQLLAAELEKQNITGAEVLDYEMFFYDTQGPALIGLKEEFVASARLDNLLSCYVIMEALINADSEQPSLLVCNDHEEIGSQSTTGADGPFLTQVLERICGTAVDLTRAMQRSVMISADNAHGIHPNFPDRHDENHGPMLNKGPVIKINAKQRYATSSETSALIRKLCKEAGVPVQAFVARTDMGCGSTIGPITSSKLGVATLDIGLPTFGMHSIRELAGSDDAAGLTKVLELFFQQETLLP